MPTLHLGFGTWTRAEHVLLVVPVSSSVRVKRLLNTLSEAGRVIDLTRGRKRRSLVLLSGEWLIISAVRAKSLRRRLAAAEGNTGGGMLHEEQDQP
ncbi:MAG TPA: DUF370 domain-containing protein [Firmicutes bacterium]|nr:DUF370 domain-containing protein [Bacillota bacterium]